VGVDVEVEGIVGVAERRGVFVGLGVWVAGRVEVTVGVGVVATVTTAVGEGLGV
jgi:hypothetical protein